MKKFAKYSDNVYICYVQLPDKESYKKEKQKLGLSLTRDQKQKSREIREQLKVVKQGRLPIPACRHTSGP